MKDENRYNLLPIDPFPSPLGCTLILMSHWSGVNPRIAFTASNREHYLPFGTIVDVGVKIDRERFMEILFEGTGRGVERGG